jgi:hypothetical protein
VPHANTRGPQRRQQHHELVDLLLEQRAVKRRQWDVTVRGEGVTTVDMVELRMAGGKLQERSRRLRREERESAVAARSRPPSLALWTDFPQDRAVLNLAPRKLDATSRKASYVA